MCWTIDARVTQANIAYLKNDRDYIVSNVPLPEQLLSVIRRKG